MSTKVFNWLTASGGGLLYGDEIVTAASQSIEPGLLVTLNSVAGTVSLAAATGSRPFGFAYGNRDLVYAPITKTFADGEALSVLSGIGLVAMSADFFSSGSLPTEVLGNEAVFAAASGKIQTGSGTNRIGRLVDLKSFYDGTGGTGTSVSVAVIQFDFSPLSS